MVEKPSTLRKFKLDISKATNPLQLRKIFLTLFNDDESK